MNGDFYAGRRAVVTGAGAGIGRALAIQLAARGADVVLWDCDGDGLARTAERCQRWDVSVQPVVVDVGDRAAVNEQARTAAESGPVDLLFCVAGTILTGTLLDSDLDDVEHVMRVNFWGTVHAVKALLPSLVASGRGQVVAVSSAFGLMAAPRYTAYCASKFAVRGFAEALRQELALGDRPVGVSCLCPGGVRTQIVRNASRQVRTPTPSATVSTGSWPARRRRRRPRSSCAASAGASRRSWSAATPGSSPDFSG